jgi:hypothetical protein
VWVRGDGEQRSKRAEERRNGQVVDEKGQQPTDAFSGVDTVSDQRYESHRRERWQVAD